MKEPSIKSLGRLAVIGITLLSNLLAEEVVFQHQFGPTGIFGNEAERVSEALGVDVDKLYCHYRVQIQSA
jgi:hypothetical protein